MSCGIRILYQNIILFIDPWGLVIAISIDERSDGPTEKLAPLNGWIQSKLQQKYQYSSPSHSQSQLFSWQLNCYSPGQNRVSLWKASHRKWCWNNLLWSLSTVDWRKATEKEHAKCDMVWKRYLYFMLSYVDVKFQRCVNIAYPHGFFVLIHADFPCHFFSQSLKLDPKFPRHATIFHPNMVWHGYGPEHQVMNKMKIDEGDDEDQDEDAD